MIVKIRQSLLTSLVITLAILGTGCATPEVNENGDVVERECRRSEERLGSKIQPKLCFSKEMWAKIDAKTEEEREDGSQMDDYFRTVREQSSMVAPRGFDSPGIGF